MEKYRLKDFRSNDIKCYRKDELDEIQNNNT